MDWSGAPEEADDDDAAAPLPPSSAWFSSGGLAIELRDRALLVRTSVCASEKAVPVRWTGSVVATGAGRRIAGSPVCHLSAGHAVILLLSASSDSGTVIDDEPVGPAGFLPSLTDVFRSIGVRRAALDGESRGTESIDGRPGVLVWFLDGGLSLGNREKVPPGCDGPVDILSDVCPASSRNLVSLLPRLCQDGYPDSSRYWSGSELSSGPRYYRRMMAAEERHSLGGRIIFQTLEIRG